MVDLGPIKAHSGTGAVWQKLSRLVIPLILLDVAKFGGLVELVMEVGGAPSGASWLKHFECERNESRFSVL